MSTNIADRFRILSAKRKRLIAYIACGLISVAVDYTVFVFFYFILKADIALATPVGLTFGLITSFTLNKIITFSDQSSKGLKQTGLQIFLYLALFIINNIFTIYFISTLLAVGVPAAIGKIISTIIITMWNYVIYKSLIFK